MKKYENLFMRLVDFYLASSWSEGVVLQRWVPAVDAVGRRLFTQDGQEVFKSFENDRVYIDQTSKKCYRYENLNVIRLKCILLTIGFPNQIVKAVSVAVVRLFKLLALYPFWSNQHAESSIQVKFYVASQEIFPIVFAPILLVGLLLSSIYGIITPLNGSKLYANFERALFGEEKKKRFCSGEWADCLFPFINQPRHMAVCFQPLSIDFEESPKTSIFNSAQIQNAFLVKA